MRIDVVFGPTTAIPALITGRVVAVIDVLRASTSIAVALGNGARNIVPLESADEVITRAKQFDKGEVRLAGERKMLTVSGFDLGNSPGEFTREAVEGKTVLLTTTNGTAAMVGLQGARDVVVASYVNLEAVAVLMRTAARAGTDITLICAGRDKLFSLEDAACAGRYVRAITQKGLVNVDLGDGAFAATVLDRKYADRLDLLFADSEAGKALAEAGFGKDLEDCAKLDSCPVIPIFQDRQITLLGPDRER
jgi:2-phosphosulfolactate phosphatase